MQKSKTKQEKIEELVQKRKKILKRLGRIDEIYAEEKTNEEAWPGHESTIFQYASVDDQVYEAHLKLIEKQLKKLGWKKDEQ